MLAEALDESARAALGQLLVRDDTLSQRPLAECPAATLPKWLRPYLLTFDSDDKPSEYKIQVANLTASL